jgi:hypothetical protein
VYVKNFAIGSPWLPGVIHRQTGPVSFVVELCDGRQVRRHQDHLRVRHDGGGKSAHGVSCKDRVGGSVEAVPVTPGHAEMSQEGLSEPSEEAPDELSEQAATADPAQSLPGGLEPSSSAEDTIPELRRSKRQHKPPNRLSC